MPSLLAAGVRHAGLAVALLPSLALAQLSFVGAGVVLKKAKVGGQPAEIQQVLRFSPGEEAGLEAGELLWEVDGKPVEALSVAEVTALIRGEAGTTRTLVVGSGRRTVTLTLREVRGRCVRGDCREGKGRIEEPTGVTYEGDFHLGKFDGEGTAWYPSGDRYEGMYHQGKQQGLGVYRNEKLGFFFHGEFANDQFQGQGRVRFDRPAYRYEGQFAGNQPSGPGVLTAPSGEERTVTPGSWDGLVALVKGSAPQSPPAAPSPAPPAAGRPAVPPRLAEDRSDRADLTLLEAHMRKTELAFSRALEALGTFKERYQQALGQARGDHQRAGEASRAPFEAFVRQLGTALELFKGLARAAPSGTITLLQKRALDGWGAELKALFDQLKAGQRGGSYAPQGYHDLRLDQAAAQEHLAAAARRRHEL